MKLHGLPINLLPGTQVYKYTLDRKIGEGQFGVVWLAHDQTIKMDYAVKFLDTTTASIGDLLKEAEVGHRTGHENLASVHFADVVDFQGDNLVLVVMDYYSRGSVLGEICSGNFVPVQTAVSLLTDILRGLEYLHEQKVVHNDIKPTNILISNKGEAVLTDYGISVAIQGGISAKPPAAYMLHKAPETIFKNEVSPKSDIYQVGMTAFRLINGIGLVRDKLNTLGSAEFKQHIRGGKLISNNDFQPFVPNHLRQIIKTAINADPDQRFGSAQQMRRKLEKLTLHGSWTQDEAGEFKGEDANNEYRFEVHPMHGGKFNFTAFRKYKSSRRETRFTKYCCKQLTVQEIQRAKKNFMSAVVVGSH
ncbi:MAG: serine/threonine-protein kinase [Gammaproteobacteria bacterium]|nr:serine/threonine-protein kinase [Gammaproteobacteria bacterium]